MSKKFQANVIEDIRKMAEIQIPAAIQSKDGISIDSYHELRMTMNILIISALLGAEFVPNKKKNEMKMKSNHMLPTKEEIAVISSILDKFINEVEEPFFEIAEESISDPDMEIPCVGGGMIPTKIEKTNKKKVRNVMLGYEGNSAISEDYFTAADCIAIAALGEQLRRKQNIQRALIIGGIVIVATAAVAGICYYNEKKRDEEIDAMIDADMEDDILGPGVDDDAPNVPMI